MKSDRRLGLGFAVIFGLIVLVCLFSLSQNLRLVDSEIWSFYLAKNWSPFEASFTGFFWKPLQVLSLRAITVFATGPNSFVQFIEAGRIFWLLLFLLQLLCLTRIAGRLKVGVPFQIFGAGLLFTSRYYLVESLRVRADSLAILFLLVLTWELIGPFPSSSADKKYPSLKITVGAFLAVFASVKFLPQVLILLGAAAFFFPDLRARLRRSLIGDLVLGLGLVGLCLALPDGWIIVKKVSQSLFEAGSSTISYRENFVFVKDQIFYLFPFWLVSGFLLASSLKKSDRESRVDAFLATFALLNSLMIVAHPEPFPWYAATSVPFHVLCAMRALRAYENVGARPAMITGLFLVGLGLANARWNFSGLETQKVAMQDLARLKETFDLKTFYDNCGLVGDLRHSVPFVTASQNTDADLALKLFRKNPPDLVVKTGRSMLILPRLADDLDQGYVKDSADVGVWIRRSLLESDEMKRRWATQKPEDVFKKFVWRETLPFETLFSPYLGYRLVD